MPLRTLALAVAIALTAGVVAAFVFASLRSPLPPRVPSIELDAEPTSQIDEEPQQNEGGKGQDRGPDGVGGGGSPRGSNEGSGATEPVGSGGSTGPGGSTGTGGSSEAPPAPPPPPEPADGEGPTETDDLSDSEAVGETGEEA